MAEFDPSDNIGTIPVQEKHQFDLQNLQDFMESSVVGFKGTLTVEEFAGGQSNPTYLLTAGGQQYVMRRKPPGMHQHHDCCEDSAAKSRQQRIQICKRTHRRL